MKAKGVTLINLSKIYPGKKGNREVRAVDNVSLDIEPGEFVTLLGPSGCGKTTTRRMIAGFEKPSGGQQQRVALARALVMEPGVLLFDEPLSNLDAKLRVQMRTEIRRIQKAVGITAIYVTHDQAEAMSMSDRIVILKDGQIAQAGAPKEVYYRPNSEFSANFIGTANILHGTVQEVNRDGTVRILVEDVLLDRVPVGERTYRSGEKCTLVIRPEACSVQAKGVFEAEVTLSTFMGAYQLYELELFGSKFTIHENNPKTKRIYKIGERARIELDISDIHII